MSPIEQVKPTLPGNWPRRVENRNKRGGKEPPPDQPEKNRPGQDSDDHPDGREHIVDDFA
jgi:hypothetical protein